MSLVVVDELHKQFGETKVLRGVNLTVEEGDVVAVIGRSGSGKSTFLRILNGLETFDAGFVKIDGDRVRGLESDLRPLRLKVGMLLQADPTVIYGLGPNFDGNLRRRDLDDPNNLYNTYQRPGLTPGPICSFGAAALAAAVRPEAHNYLYFVAKFDGGEHGF